MDGGGVKPEAIRDYIREKADENRVRYDEAEVLFDVVGEGEMYDAFVTLLEEYAWLKGACI